MELKTSSLLPLVNAGTQRIMASNNVNILIDTVFILSPSQIYEIILPLITIKKVWAQYSVLLLCTSVGKKPLEKDLSHVLTIHQSFFMMGVEDLISRKRMGMVMVRFLLCSLMMTMMV